MSTIRRTQRQVRPIHPGEMIREDFAADYGLSTKALAAALFIPEQTVIELVGERIPVTPALALRLSRFFGTGPDFWLNAQRAVDLWDAGQALAADLSRIQPVSTTSP